jgi:PAS domain S-box-containing protein
MPNLHTSSFEMFQLFEMTPDLVCIAGKDGYFKKVNHAVVDKLGYTEEELFARPIASFIHPQDQELTASRRTELLNGQALIDFENRYVSKEGNYIWLHWTSIYLPDKEIVFALAKDVTERKKGELEIERKYKKYKSLATHFKTTIEKDRKYLALELHEELAQLASIVKMDLDWLSSGSNLITSAQSRIDHATTVCDLLIRAIRRMSYSISPGMIEDLGLVETLKWLCTEFSTLNGIPCRFHTACDVDRLPAEIQLDFFRICQEALSNVIYHAGATEAAINIESIGNRICLSITDNGKGFEPGTQAQTDGLTEIQQRAASINGEVIINSEIGKGTRISFLITP